jgi:hypothetical protein
MTVTISKPSVAAGAKMVLSPGLSGTGSVSAINAASATSVAPAATAQDNPVAAKIATPDVSAALLRNLSPAAVHEAVEPKLSMAQAAGAVIPLADSGLVPSLQGLAEYKP